MELLFLLIEKLGVYSPIFLVILYILYYFISNSLIFIFFICIGFAFGIYMNKIIREKAKTYFNIIL